MSKYNKAIQDAVELGVPHDVALKAVNKLWGYNVDTLLPWSKTLVDFTIFTRLKDGTQFDTIFSPTGRIIRRKMIAKIEPKY